MRTKLAIASLALAVALVIPAAGQTTGVTGTWKMTVTVPGSNQDIDLVIEPSGEGIAARWTVEGKEYKGTGTVKGTAIEWTMSDSQNGTEVKFLFTGTITPGPDGRAAEIVGEFGPANGGERAAWKAVRDLLIGRRRERDFPAAE